MQTLVKNLDDATAIRVLQAFSAGRSRQGDLQTHWSPELQEALAEDLDAPNATAAVSEGDLAREALLLLANDPENRQPLTALIQSAPPEKFLDTGTLAVGVAALVVLQTYVKFEKTRDGKIVFKVEKKPLPAGLLAKLASFFFRHPPHG